MKVLYVIDSLAAGGAERSLVELLAPLAGLGVEVTIATLFDRPGLRDEAAAAGATVTSVDGATLRTRVTALRALLRATRPDLVHTTLYLSDVAGRLAAASVGTPVTSSLVNVHYGAESVQPGVPRWKVAGVQVLDALTARATPRLHAVSAAVADVMSSRLRYPRERISVIRRGRDPDRLGRRSPERRAAARGALGLSPQEPLVLAVGRHEHQKGFDLLVDAMPTLRAAAPGAVLAIAGRDGRQSEVLRSRIAAHGLGATVRLLGARGDVADLYCAADVVAVPSRHEGLPGAVIEAMALEAPLVVSGLAATLELVDGQSALVVAPSTAKALADALEDVLVRDPDGAARRAQRARARFEAEFTVGDAARRMHGFWLEVLRP